MEWTAQWLLAGQGILTGDLKPEQIPASLPITANPDGKFQAGLRNAWELAAPASARAAVAMTPALLQPMTE